MFKNISEKGTRAPSACLYFHTQKTYVLGLPSEAPANLITFSACRGKCKNAKMYLWKLKLSGFIRFNTAERERPLTRG